MQQTCTADVCTRFSLLIKAFVADRDSVSVISAVSATGVPIVRVQTAQQDRKRLLGRGSEVARSLRVLLDCIGEQQGVRYVLEIEEVRFEPRCFEIALTPTPAATVPETWIPAGSIPAY